MTAYDKPATDTSGANIVDFSRQTGEFGRAGGPLQG